MKFLTDEELKQSLSNPIFHLIGETADELQMECYVIGGFVRDLFLERPSNDIDCVVVGSGITIAKAVAEKIKEKFHKKPHIAVYANFGTAQIHFDGNEIEFVGARRESYSHDSRKPVVEDGTLEDDQNRRDFTINAMALCLNTNRFGELVDPFYGLEDLEDGIIRTPLDPDITFSDDPLRMMRCVRFATQLNFFIEDETFDALQRNAERIKIISGERIADEFNKIMLAKHPSKGIMDLERCGLLQLILPELVALEGVETMNGRGHKDNFYHTLAVLENVVKAQESENEELRTKNEECLMEDDNVSNFQSSPSGDERGALWLRWAALLHDIGKPKSKRWDASNGWTFHNHDFYGQKMVPNIFRRMKLPLDERMKYVQKLVALHMRPIVIADEEVTDSAVRRLLSDAGDNIDDLMMLCEADITSKNELKKARFLENFRIVREKIADLKERDYKRLFQPVIDGDEIMQMFNLKPSREVGTLKQSLKDAILDGIIPNEPDAARQFLIEKGKEMGLAPKE
jgi:tRNA nucleotidyltransferase/poly(A) polymerase